MLSPPHLRVIANNTQFGGGGAGGEYHTFKPHPVVQKMDSAIHRINNYPMDKS